MHFPALNLDIWTTRRRSADPSLRGQEVFASGGSVCEVVDGFTGRGVVNGDDFDGMIDRLREDGFNKAQFACDVIKAPLPPSRDLDPVAAVEAITAK